MSCLEADFDAATGTCAAPIWDADVSAIPTLSIADAQAIGLSFAGLFAVAFVFRLMRKALHQIG